jgi:murein DD-endopeptidase MepM/ murein hydrolase activator NlpD
MTVAFLMVVIAVAVSVVVLTPKYAEPAAGAALVPTESSDPAVDPSADPLAATAVMAERVPTSLPPNKLRGYRWPVRGGTLVQYYDDDPRGRHVIKGRPVHTGIVVTWFEGAKVKAAHKGTVVAVGRDWEQHVGYAGDLESVREHRQEKGTKAPRGVVIDDGNGYHSVYTELKNLRVEPDDVIDAGQIIGEMSAAEGRKMMRYRLVRMDGIPMKVGDPDRERGYPRYTAEQVDPLVVMNLDAKSKPSMGKRPPPEDPPRLSDY